MKFVRFAVGRVCGWCRMVGSQFAQDCVCRIERRVARMLERARIPKRYEHCTLDSYDTDLPTRTERRALAHLTARKFVESFPLETGGRGLLLTGSIGVGKTHLAVGILQALVAERGANGLFYDYRDLLKQVQNSYNAAGSRRLSWRCCGRCLRPRFWCSMSLAHPSRRTGCGTRSPIF